MAGVRVPMSALLLVTVIIWLMMCAVITTQAFTLGYLLMSKLLQQRTTVVPKIIFPIPLDKTAIHIPTNSAYAEQNLRLKYHTGKFYF
jgi:energy-converting hydrogenase Eha subunit A